MIHIKRIFISLFVLWLFVGCSDDDSSDIKHNLALEAVPVNSTLICEVKNLKLLEKQAKNTVFFQILKRYDFFSDLVQSEKIIRKIAIESEQSADFTVALARVGVSRLSAIFIFDSKNKYLDDNFDFGKDTIVFTSKYNGHNFYMIKLEDDHEFYFFKYKSLVVGSKDRLYLEQSLLQLDGKLNVLSDVNLTKYYNLTKSQENAYVLVNLKELSLLINVNCGFGKIDITNNFGYWVIADLTLDKNILRLNGVVSKGEQPMETFADVLSSQSSIDFKLDTYFPKNTTFYTYYAVSNWNKFFKDYIRYVKFNGEVQVYNRKISVYNKALQTNNFYENFFSSWAGEGIAAINVNMPGLSYPESTAIFISVKNKDEFFKNFSALENTSVKSQSYKNIDIYNLNYQSFFSDLFALAFASEGTSYYAYVNGVAIFVHNLQVLKSCIDSIENNTTLGIDRDYLESKKNIQGYSNMVFMFNGENLVLSDKEQIKWLKKNKKKVNELEFFISENDELVGNLGYNFLQFSDINSTPFINLILTSKANANDYTPEQEDEKTSKITENVEQKTSNKVSHDISVGEMKKMWSYNFAIPSADLLMAFPNHTNGRYDILLQNSEKSLYLINYDGKLHWKKKLAAKLKPEDVRIVDIFKNRKYQMVLNINGNTVVFDRNGEEVKGKNLESANFLDNLDVLTARKTNDGSFVLDVSLEKNDRQNKIILSPEGEIIVY